MEVVRKDIKNLHVGVYPPGGRVRVAAPLHLDDDALRMAVISRLGWIRRSRANSSSRIGNLRGSSCLVKVTISRVDATGLT